MICRKAVEQIVCHFSLRIVIGSRVKLIAPLEYDYSPALMECVELAKLLDSGVKIRNDKADRAYRKSVCIVTEIVAAVGPDDPVFLPSAIWTVSVFMSVFLVKSSASSSARLMLLPVFLL